MNLRCTCVAYESGYDSAEVMLFWSFTALREGFSLQYARGHKYSTGLICGPERARQKLYSDAQIGAHVLAESQCTYSIAAALPILSGR